MQMTLHVFDLPQSQRNAGSKKIGKAGSQTAQLKTDLVAIKPNRAVEVLD
jgi:hypothetical protein